MGTPDISAGGAGMNSLLERLGGFAARRHWIVIIAWLVILGGTLWARQAFGGEFVNNYTVSGSGSALGLDRLNQDFPQQGGYAGQIVFHAKTGKVSDSQSAVNQATSNVAKLPDVIKAVSPFASPSSGAVSKDGTIAYSSVSWNVNPDSLDTDYLSRLDQAVAPARSAGLQVEYGGGAGQIGQVTKDLKSEVIGLACALILLLFMFGSLIAAAIPLLSAIFSVGAGLSLLGLLAAASTFPTTAPTIATLLGLGVAVDYGLFLMARHREQMDTGMDLITSAARAEGTSGAAIVVAVTMLAALTLVPAFRGVAGSNVRSLSARFRARKAGISAQEQAARSAAATQEQHEHSAFARWGRKVSERPWPWAVASVAFLIILAIPLCSITLVQPRNGTNPTSDSSRRAYDLISQGFGPGANGPLAVVVQLPKQSSSDNQSLLNQMTKDVAATSGVASVSPATVNQDGNTAVFSVVPTTRPQASQPEDLVSRLRTDVLPKEHVTSYVTGTTAGTVDFTEQITGRMVWLILAVVVIAFILLTMAFRSVVIATKAAILNLLSIGAAYGVIVAIFQWGWGASLIGVHTTLPIPAYVPMLVFAIVFGLSMDYEVFLLSRVHEAWIETGDPHRAVAVGIGATARVITTAAAIMVVVFASFVLSTDPTVKMLAIGMAFAVLIDASLVRMILVPSIMALLDARAWWMPRWMEPIVPQLQLEGSTAPAASAAPVAPAPAAPAPAGAAQTAAATDTEAETATAAATDTEAETETAAQAVSVE